MPDELDPLPHSTLTIDTSRYTYLDQNALAAAERRLKTHATLEGLINSGHATPDTQAAYLRSLESDPVQANFDATCNMFAKCVVEAPAEWFDELRRSDDFSDPTTYHKLRLDKFGELNRAIAANVSRPKA